MNRIGVSLALVFSLASCSKSEQALTPANAPQAAAKVSPEELGELGSRIRKDPEHAKDILSARGLSESSFESEIRKVAADPAASRRYAAAFQKTKT